MVGVDRETLADKDRDTRALQAYLGPRNIQHTVRYTELSPGRFKDFWRRSNSSRSSSPRWRFNEVLGELACGFFAARPGGDQPPTPSCRPPPSAALKDELRRTSSSRSSAVGPGTLLCASIGCGVRMSAPVT